MKSIRAALKLLLAAVLLAGFMFTCFMNPDSAHAATSYHVNPVTGDDANNGSTGAPWRTLAHACGSPLLQAGDTIVLSSGRFVESSQCVVPSGVNIQGQGPDKTLITSTVAYSATSGFDSSPGKYIILARNANHQTFNNFSLDGASRTVHGGLMVQGSYITVSNMKVTNFNYNGVYIEQVSDHVNVHRLSLIDNAREDTISCTGGLMFGSISDSQFHDVFVSESRKAFGIKHFRTDWTTQAIINHAPNSPLTNVKFYNIHIDVPQAGAWGSGNDPDISLETWKTKPNNVEIYNSTFTNTLSLASADNSSPLTFNVYNNDFALNYGQYRYALEIKGQNARVHHNQFNGGFYAIADFANSSNVSSNFTIDHNVFMNQGGVTPQVLNLLHPYTNLKFINNTIYSSQNHALIQLYNAANTNWQIKNNIFARTNAGTTNFYNFINGATVASPAISINLFFNVQVPAGSTTHTTGAAPQIQLSGTAPDPFFRPSAVSPSNIIDRGVAVTGITTGSTGNPDLGAIESGSSTWSPGSKITAAFKSVATGQIVSVDQTNSPSWGLIANRTSISYWEKTTMTRNSDTTLSFKADHGANDKYVSVDTANSSVLVASATAIGMNEKFDLYKNKDGTLSFKSKANGKYISADPSTKKLFASKTAANPATDLTVNEKFEMFVP